MAEYLVDQHAGENADENTNDGQTKHGPQTRVYRPVDHLAVGRCSKHVTQGGVVINGARVHDPRETSAGFCGGLVDAFAQSLQPVHVDDGGGDRHHHAQQGGEKTETAANFDQTTFSVICLREKHHHYPCDCHSHSWNIGGDGFKVVQRRGGVPDDEVDGDEEASEDDREGAAYDGEHDILLE